MMRTRLSAALILTLLLPLVTLGADHLRLNPHLNFKRNNHQGALIFGDHMEDGAKPGMVNYVVFYAEFCYNAKRQAKRTVELYNQYHGKVHFVIVDFEYGWSWVQNKLVVKYFTGNIPQIVILDAKGRAVFNYIGEAPKSVLEGWLNATLEYPGRLAEVNQPMDKPGSMDATDISHNPLVILKDHLGR